MTTRVVVGANGALGSLLGKFLGAKAIDLRHPGECLDAAVPDIAAADVVINASGPRVRPGLGWNDYLREHVGTAGAVARAMRPGSHLVHISSAAVWGAGRGNIGRGTSESPRSFPNPSYAWAKLSGELAARAVCAERGVGLTVVRPTMVYGEGVSSAIDTMFSLAKRGVLVELTPGEIKQHCLHVSLLHRAVEAIISRRMTSPEAVPLADPFIFTNRELYEAVARKHRGVRVPVSVRAADTLLRHWPMFPDRDGPGALAAFACLALDNQLEWRGAFEALALDPADFGKDRTLTPYWSRAA
ncbi:MAG: NAD-dependent epimerase/dehydratase family protein [Myxococcota bacterium]|nr:NAD-dependent epimerase/dehydratase family protein [Myxococcota bacterium]